MLASGELPLANYEGLGEVSNEFDPSMTWDLVGWLRDHCDMLVVLKGVVTAEYAELAVTHGADGLRVSNHGGRQDARDYKINLMAGRGLVVIVTYVLRNQDK